LSKRLPVVNPLKQFWLPATEKIVTKNYSLAIFAILIVILMGAVWFHTGSPLPPSGENAIWFHAGLFTLLIGTFIVEYRFTRPNDVFVNCLVVFASTSTLTDPPYQGWWMLVRWGALICGVTAIALAWDPGREAKLSEQKFRAILYQIVIRLGNAEVLFSIVFVLALISYFNFDSPDAKYFAIAWGAFLIAAHIDLPTLGKIAFRPGKYQGRRVLALTHSFLAPSIVYCKRLNSEKVNLHQIVGFCQSTNADCHCFGLVIGELSSAAENRLAVALLNTTITKSQLNERSIVVTTTAFDKPAMDAVISADELGAIKNIIGTVAKGTNISRIKFELFGNPKIVAGSLLSVKSGDKSVFYQVFDGIVEEEQSIKDSDRAFVEGDAEQIGCWDSGRGGFETHDWVAQERSQVHLLDDQNPPPPYELKESEMTIGVIPNSIYPVNIDIKDLVLYHTGILGVTGSGKSFLTFSIIEECASKGIKTICIDPTGDYQRYLDAAVLLPTLSAVKAFLNSNEHMIGIVETATGSFHPIDLTERIARICLEWCKANRQNDEILHPRPKIMLALEEAHILVPEWNSNPTQGLKDKVNSTSQVVLQARKYGLGFLIVSQRTANVIKTILNQCNTIFSFQAFDETSFEFLKNYMGHHHVKSLPNLKTRHGLLVGKASRSRRPVMVHFKEQNRNLRAAPAQNMPMPQGGQEADEDG
jgi:hypothetical protein